jgi:hypothetical protein
MKKPLPEKGKIPSTFFFPLFAFGFDEVASHEGCGSQHTQRCKYCNSLHSWLFQKDSQATRSRRHCVDIYYKFHTETQKMSNLKTLKID